MTAPTPRDDLDAAAAELLALQHTDHPLPGWDVTCAVCRLTPAEAFRLGYRAAVAAYRATQDGEAEEADANGCPDRQHHGVDCPGDACRFAADDGDCFETCQGHP